MGSRHTSRGSRLRLVLAAAIAAVTAAGAAQVATASPPTPATGAAIVTAAPLVDQRLADGNIFSTRSASWLMVGTISGTMAGEFHTIIHSDGSVNYHGTATCTCTVEGRAGTIVLHFAGSGPSMPESTGHAGALPGTATGGLEGLHVELALTSFPVTLYEGGYHFDP